MKTTSELGNLVVTAFDVAATYSSDPREITLLATSAVVRILGAASRVDLASHAMRGTPCFTSQTTHGASHDRRQDCSRSPPRELVVELA